MSLRTLVFGAWPKFKPPSPQYDGAHSQALPGSGQVGEAPYSQYALLGEQHPPAWLNLYNLPVTWPIEMTPGGVPGIRAPREVQLAIGQIAGLGSVDGANNTGHTVFLPPIRDAQRGATLKAVSGGSNRVSINSGLNSREAVPAVYVPLG